nr:putative transposase for insertion sequence element IS402 domain protein [Rhodococcus sp. JVH1]
MVSVADRCSNSIGQIRADMGYDYDKHRRWLREHGIVPGIARRGIDRNDRLGRYRWKIERTMSRDSPATDA